MAAVIVPVPGAASARTPLEVPRRFGGIRGRLGIHPGLVLLAAIAVVYPLVASSYWTFHVAAGLVLAISCLGLLVVVGWLREISLMQAGLTGASVSITAALSVDTFGEGEALRFPVAAACGIAFAVVLSAVVALVGMRLAGVYLIVLTFAAQVLVENAVFTSQTLFPGMADWSYPRPNLFTMNLRSDTRLYYMILVVLAVVTVFLHRLRRSRFGRAMILVGADPEAAAAVGISPWRYRVGAFALAGLCAGVSGALASPLYYGPSTLQYISFNSLFYLAIPIVAGFESLTGVIVVAVTFTLIPQVLLDWRINVFIVAGLGLAVGVLLGPRGVSGRLADLVDGRASRRQIPRRAGTTP